MAIFNINATPNTGTLPAQNAFAKLHGIPTQYQAVISVTNRFSGNLPGFPIVARLPEQYTLHLSSNWDTPFASYSLNNVNIPSKSGNKLFDAGAKLLNGKLGTVSSVIGTSPRDKYQMVQVYSSNTPIGFNVDLQFSALTNTFEDVKKNHILLFKLLAPTEKTGGIMQNPGPSIRDSLVMGRSITVQLGSYITLRNAIVKDVQSTIKTICGADGTPHQLVINVSFESVFQVTTDKDIDSLFNIT